MLNETQLVKSDFHDVQGVRITLVDNFQGEENFIILLSLVRSNSDGIIGFLREDNRVNVALSRAKHGLFIFGNMDTLCMDEKKGILWRKIKDVLADQGSFGTGVPLKCQVHPEKELLVLGPNEFPVGGGCREVSDKTFSVDHFPSTRVVLLYRCATFL